MSKPVFASTIGDYRRPKGLASDGDLVLVTMGATLAHHPGVAAYDVSDPASPVFLTRLEPAGWASWVDQRALLSGGYYHSTSRSDGVSLVQLRPTGDLNGDGGTDSADLSTLLGAFGGPASPEEPADLNGDGFVDAADLSTLIGAFGCGL